MHKAMILIRRADGMDFDEFLRYWEDEHSPMADDMPGLVKYTRDIPVNPEAADADGAAQLYFESKEAMKAGLTSEVGQALQDDLENFCDPEQTVLLADELVEIDRT